MQVFKLVYSGLPDKVIAFDSLPPDLLVGVKRAPIKGFPRHWSRWFERDLGLDLQKEPRPFYFLDYQMINADKHRWQEIVGYVKRMAPTEFRLLDKIEDMAAPLAKDSYAELSLDPEDIPVIPLTKIEVPVTPPPEPLRKKPTVSAAKQETKIGTKVA